MKFGRSVPFPSDFFTFTRDVYLADVEFVFELLDEAHVLVAFADDVLEGVDLTVLGTVDGVDGAALAVQSYHVLEHTVKIIQHVSTGIDPAPGILGQVGLSVVRPQ